MKQLIRTHRIIAIASGALLLVLGIALWQFAGRVSLREARVIEVRDRLASFEQNKRQHAEESAKLATIKQTLGTFEKHIITEASTPALLSSIEAMAAREGIDFTITSVVATSAVGDKQAKLHIDFSADGSFGAIQRFVKTLLAQPYQVQITRMSLFATAAKSGTWQLLAGIDIISF